MVLDPNLSALHRLPTLQLYIHRLLYKKPLRLSGEYGAVLGAAQRGSGEPFTPKCHIHYCIYSTQQLVRLSSCPQAQDMAGVTSLGQKHCRFINSLSYCSRIYLP